MLIRADGTTSPNTYARLIGVLLLVIAVLGPFSILYVPSEIVVSGDAATTAENARDSTALLRAAVVSDVVIFLVEIAVTVLLFVLLRPVSGTVSLMAALARLGQTVVMAVNVFLLFAVLLLVSGAGYLAAFAPDQLDALVLLAFDTHAYGVYVGQFFFAFHLLLLAWLVQRAGFVPSVLGWLLLVASLGYFADALGNAVAPDAEEALGALVGVTSVIGELPFFLWLLIKGVDVGKWRERASASATSPA